MSEEQLQSTLASALEYSVAEQTEARITAGRWALTRFANSGIHQNMASENAELHVRAVFGKKVASGSTNRTDEAAVRALVDNVVEMARLQDENPDFVSLPGPAEHLPEADPYVRATAESTPDERAEMVTTVVGEAEAVEATAAGSATISAGERAVANSLGVRSYYRGTAAQLATVLTGPEGGFGYASATAADVGDIDPRAVGSEAAARTYESRNPRDLEPGDYECVLMPYAVSDMVAFLSYMGFSALTYQEGRSFLCGKLGKKIVGDGISIYDDGLDPRTIVAPFDAEGVPKQRIDLISEGVAGGLLQDSYTAQREGKKSTGHYPRGHGTNLIMRPGDARVAEMIANTKRGLLVTRFHYTNIAHLMTATITGMTRDGTFLIENGRIKHPVKNLRFTQSILEALSNVEGVGGELKLSDGVLAPAIKVSKFRFSSATQF